MSEQGPRLQRRLGLIDTTLLALGAIIGAGIFVALSPAVGAAASALPLAIVLSALVATCNGLSAVQLGVNYPRAGGAYEFGYALLTPWLGFAAGWLFLLAGIAASATAALAFAGYLQPLWPGIPLPAVSAGVALLVTAINAAGVGLTRRINNGLVVLKIAVLLIFIGVGLAALARSRVAPLPAPSWRGTLRAGALLFFAFSGYARPVTVVEEVRDPVRNLPRAVIAALAGSTALYLAVAVTALLLIGVEGLAQSTAPLRDALLPTSIRWAPALVSGGALIAIITVALSETWGLSRMAFAMARRGDLPAALSRVSPDGVPRVAVLGLGGLVTVLAGTGSLEPVLAASSLGLLLYYSIMNLAALRLRRTQRLYPRLVSVAGLGACLALAFSLPASAGALVGAALALGLLYYGWQHRRG